MLSHKGYRGQFEVDTDAGLIFGRVLDIRDVVTFKGKTVEEAVQAFKDSVDDYLEFCQEIGEKPNKPFSGKLPFRTTPETHRLIYIAARKEGKSINSWMESVLRKASQEVLHEPKYCQADDFLEAGGLKEVAHAN